MTKVYFSGESHIVTKWQQHTQPWDILPKSGRYWSCIVCG